MFERLPVWWLHIMTLVCIITSTSEFRFDVEKRQLKKAGYLIKIFVYGSTLLFMLKLPFAMRDSLVQDELFFCNIVAVYVNWLTAFFRYVLVCLFAFRIYHRHKRLGDLLERVLLLQVSYFDCHPRVPKDTGHRKWLVVNSLLAITHYVLESCVTEENDMMESYDLDFAQATVFALINIQHFYMLQHATLLCYLRECFSVLRHQLATKDINSQLHKTYGQLRDLHEEVNDIYGPLISIILLCSFLTNSMLGYVLLMYMNIPSYNIDLYIYIFGNGLYFWILLHLYVYVMLCDRVESAIKDIDLMLYEYTTEPGVSQELEMIVFSRSLHWPGTNICHQININRGFLFCILAETVSYIITLIQCDYVNLI